MSDTYRDRLDTNARLQHASVLQFFTDYPDGKLRLADFRQGLMEVYTFRALVTDLINYLVEQQWITIHGTGKSSHNARFVYPGPESPR